MPSPTGAKHSAMPISMAAARLVRMNILECAESFPDETPPRRSFGPGHLHYDASEETFFLVFAFVDGARTGREGGSCCTGPPRALPAVAASFVAEPWGSSKVWEQVVLDRHKRIRPSLPRGYSTSILGHHVGGGICQERPRKVQELLRSHCEQNLPCREDHGR